MMWMNPAVQKTLSLLLLIGIGALLRTKIKGKESLKGVKVLILSIALPATIFVALLKIEVEPQLLFLPIIALGFNLLMLWGIGKVLPWLDIDIDSPTSRTLMMLFPSLAPGLSCFPFLMEYLGDETLALAALADVGNKVFVLILLYLLAMHWYYQQASQRVSSKGKLKDLLLALVREPVNLMIVIALILLGFGLNIEALPSFMENAVLRMSAMMTPLILLFIGMAVRIQWSQIKMIFSVLLFRSGIAFLLSAIAILFAPSLAPATLLLIVVFPQSACSFWPFAHMAAIDAMQESEEGKGPQKIFDTEFALAVLACSLPFSTILIMGICSIGTFFADPFVLIVLACLLVGAALMPHLFTAVGWSEKKKTSFDKPSLEQ